MNVAREIQIHFGDKLKSIEERSRKRIYVEVEREHIPAFAKLIIKVLGARFITASGVHTPNGFEILYHFSFDGLNKIVTAKTYLDAKKPEIETISNIIEAANWIEREMWELLGINFRNHPNLKRLLLDDDWPEGDYPLRHEKK